MSFEADGYEQLPLNASTIFSVTGGGRKKANNTTTSSAEDNGLTLSLDAPLDGHMTLSGFYNRSFRAQDDVVGLSATFLLKASPKKEAVK